MSHVILHYAESDIFSTITNYFRGKLLLDYDENLDTHKDLYRHTV